MSNELFSRKRAPIGGHPGPPLLASCRAGQMYPCVQSKVTRIACPMNPACTSSYRTSPGRIGNPAASAEVQVSGRREFEPSGNAAPLQPLGDPPFHWVPEVSYKVHVSLFTIKAWRSEPPSIGVEAVSG